MNTFRYQIPAVLVPQLQNHRRCCVSNRTLYSGKRNLLVGWTVSIIENLSNPGDKQSKTLEIPLGTAVRYQYMNSFATEFANLSPSRSNSSNQVAFDALSVSRSGVVTLFQITIGEDHTIKWLGLNFLNSAVAMEEGRRCGFKSLFPTQRERYRVLSAPRRRT